MNKDNRNLTVSNEITNVGSTIEVENVISGNYTLSYFLNQERR